jgi:cytoskeleton protein RodZ
MSDGPAGASTAGAMLRTAREKQGLHIAALAAAIKVTPRKLDALENDRLHELPDATFARALAQTVCRTLKIDPRPVLELLPHADAAALEHVAGTLSTPFRERWGRDEPGLAGLAIRPMVWAGALLMLAALVVYFLPAGFWKGEVPSAPMVSAPAPAMVQAASAPVALASVPALAASQAVVETVFSAPPPELAASSQPVTGAVQLRTTESSWIEVRDGRGQVLLSRTVVPGESVGLDGPRPIRLTIGNASAVQLGYRGQPVDLAPLTRDNIARVALQ